MNKDGLVYSTNPNLELSKQNSHEEDDVVKCTLSVCYEKKGRAGKGVTIIKGLSSSSLKLALLSQKLKKSLSIGGTVKNGEIILQGRLQEQVIKILEKEGYKAKKVGG
ncbi:MAG: translation initiation factor [Flavobacteriales bacterium]|nr:translation initiation factor [Flavobacteriales bacterium]|tara:strand:+ start:10668 stop:10991 length:324 start_codon:yes stop_codon:yes gene_type:complete